MGFEYRGFEYMRDNILSSIATWLYMTFPKIGHSGKRWLSVYRSTTYFIIHLAQGITQYEVWVVMEYCVYYRPKTMWRTRVNIIKVKTLELVILIFYVSRSLYKLFRSKLICFLKFHSFEFSSALHFKFVIQLMT